MNNSRKIIFMCLIPIVLTIFFIVQFTVPAMSEYFRLNKEIKQQKATAKRIKSNIELLKSNKAVAEELDKINTDLIGFEIEFPQEFKDEILLIDLEIFANESINRIVGLRSFQEKEIEITNSNESKKKKKRLRSREKPTPPVQIFEKSFEINTVAYYNEIIDFVTFLESYQRKININGITAKIFNEDKESVNPRIEMRISGSTYISKINETSSPPIPKAQPTKK